MLKRSNLLFLLICISFGLSAQDKPIFLPEDLESTTLGLKCLCKPGVQNKSKSRGLEISYHITSGSEITNEDGAPLQEPLSQIQSLQNLIFKLKIPIVNKNGFKLFTGITYRPEEYHFDVIGADYQNVFQHLDATQLKSSGFELLGIKSLNEKFYASIRFRALYNGDYNGLINFDKKYAIYNFSALFGIKKNDDFEYGFGLNFTNSFRSTLALPFILINKNFNDKFGIEAALPALVMARYNFSPKTILLSGLRYNSRSYAIKVPEIGSEQLYEMNHSELRFVTMLEQQLHSWVWLNLEGGYQVNFSSDFEAIGNADANFKVEPRNAPYFRIGLFVSPPDKFFK